MGLRNARPLTWRPKGVSDAVDGTNAFPGAMTALTNLIPAPGTAQAFVPRPASVQVTDFTGFTTPAGGTALFVLGDLIFGMISSADFSGKDVPFCYDTATSSFIAISGQTAANLPATQATTGDWVPPTMDVVGDIVLVTHPGFSGANKFGWIDFTSFSLTTLKGNVTNGSAVIASIAGDGTSTPILDGVQPGQAISAGSLFPAGTTVVSVANGTYDANVTGDTHTSTTVDSLPVDANRAIGMYITGPGIPAGAYITALPSTTSVTISAAATASATGVAINISGGGSITVSNAATGITTNLQALTIAGGTAAAPIWAAGDLNVNPLPAVPTAVKNFNARAYFAVGTGVVLSDSGLPLNRTNASQALTFENGLAVTALGALPLNATAGGIIQSIIAFQGDSNMVQITGDPATNNLAKNNLGVGVGTLAPNTICQTPRGLAFISQDGLRIIDFLARVSDPIGAHGGGVTLAFINAIDPSRMCAAFNENVFRVSVKNGNNPSQTVEEYWFDFSLQIWTGPHTFPASLIQPFQGSPHGFVLFANGVDAKLWSSQAIPTTASSYTENGVALSWTYQTILLPDNQQMEMNAVVESALAMELTPNTQATIIFTDDDNIPLDTVYLTGPGSSASLWGAFNWGAPSVWGSGGGIFQQHAIPWHLPLVFKQGTLQVTGTSGPQTIIGNLYLRYQILGYMLQRTG